MIYMHLLLTRNEIDWKFISKFLLENQIFNHLKFLHLLNTNQTRPI